MNKAGTQGIVSDKFGPLTGHVRSHNSVFFADSTRGHKRLPIEPLDALPRYNGAPGQQHLVIRQNQKTGERSLDRLWWGLPHWCSDPDGGRKPINRRFTSYLPRC